MEEKVQTFIAPFIGLRIQDGVLCIESFSGKPKDGAILYDYCLADGSIEVKENKVLAITGEKLRWQYVGKDIITRRDFELHDAVESGIQFDENDLVRRWIGGQKLKDGYYWYEDRNPFYMLTSMPWKLISIEGRVLAD